MREAARLVIMVLDGFIPDRAENVGGIDWSRA